MSSSVIEINGKRYDVHTGASLDGGPKLKPQRRLDGVVAPSHVVKPTKKAAGHAAAKATAKAHRPAVASAEPRTPSMRDVVRPASRGPQPARTLMRKAVTKPAIAAKPHASTQLPVKHVIMEVVPKLSVAAVDRKRLHHATAVHKSQLISRYNLDVVPVHSRPGVAAARPATPPLSRPTQPVAARPQTTADLLQHAIQQANSHRQPAPRLKRPAHRTSRIASISTLALLSLLLFGFVLHLNMSNIKLDLASSKAGFAANLPADQPSGFSLKHLTATTGQVAINFVSNSDSGRNYTITEKPSTWDSSTLRDMFVVSASGDKYQTVNTGGRTLYLYGQQNITWVNGGVWYQVHSGGALGDRQLIGIATSL